MLCTTVQEMLQGKQDQQVKDHVLYLVCEKDRLDEQNTHHPLLLELAGKQGLHRIADFFLSFIGLEEAVFYVGKTIRDPRERLYEHLFQSRQPNKSILGTFIIQNLPASLNWIIKLFTLKDCEILLLTFSQDTAIKGMFTFNDQVSLYTYLFIDNLHELLPDSPIEVQRIKAQLLERLRDSRNDNSALKSIFKELEQINNRLGKEIPYTIKEHYLDKKILERYYDPQYLTEVAEFMEKNFMLYLQPYLNIQQNTPRLLPSKYATTICAKEIVD